MDGGTHAGPRLPPELCLWIIDILYISELSDFYASSYENRLAGLSTLYACALTCHSWRDHAQYLLFHVVYLRTIRALRSLTDVIRASPRLGTYVEQIALFHEYPNSADSATASFPASLKGLLPHLQSIEISAANSEATEKPTSIPLHQRFPLWLGSFHTVTTFILDYTTFSSFGTFLRVVNAFPRLTHLHLHSGIRWGIIGHLPPFMTTTGAAPEVGSESLSSRRRRFLPHLEDLLIGEPWPQEELQTVLASLGPSLTFLYLPHPLFRAKVPVGDDMNSDSGNVDVQTPPTPPPSLSLAHLHSLRRYGVYMHPDAESPRHLASLAATMHSWWTSVDASVSLPSRRTISITLWREDEFTRNDFLSALFLLGSQIEEMIFAPLASQTEHTSESVLLDVKVSLEDRRDRWEEWRTAVAACFPRLFKLGALETKMRLDPSHLSDSDSPEFIWKDYDSVEPLQVPERPQAAGSSKRAEDPESTTKTNVTENTPAAPSILTDLPIDNRSTQVTNLQEPALVPGNQSGSGADLNHPDVVD